MKMRGGDIKKLYEFMRERPLQTFCKHRVAQLFGIGEKRAIDLLSHLNRHHKKLKVVDKVTKCGYGNTEHPHALYQVITGKEPRIRRTEHLKIPIEEQPIERPRKLVIPTGQKITLEFGNIKITIE